MFLSEEKLSVQIRKFDLVHVRYCQSAIEATGHAHHGEVLQQFAPDRSCADQEQAMIEHLLDERPTKHSRLPIVAIVSLKKGQHHYK